MKDTVHTQENSNIAGHGARGAQLSLTPADDCHTLQPVQPSNPTDDDWRAVKRAGKGRAPSAHSVAIQPLDSEHGAQAIAALSEACERVLHHRYVCSGGAPKDQTIREEAVAVFRDALLDVCAPFRCVPVGEGSDALRVRSFPTVRGLAFRMGRAIRKARTEARRVYWGKGREDARCLSVHTFALETGVTVEGADCIGIEDAGLVELGVRGAACMGHTPAEFRPVGGATGARLGLFETRARSSFLRILRLRVWWFRSCLVVFWSDKGGQRWKAGLRDDLNRLAHAARIARHGSLGDGSLASMLSDDGATCADSLRQSAKRLRDRIAQGDKLQTDKPQAAELHLKLYRRGRAWERRPFVCESLDAPHVGHASTLGAAKVGGDWMARSEGDAHALEAIRTAYAARLVRYGARLVRAEVASARRATASQAARVDAARRADYVAWWCETLATREAEQAQGERDDRATRFAACRAMASIRESLRRAAQMERLAFKARTVQGDADRAESCDALAVQYVAQAQAVAAGADLGGQCGARGRGMERVKALRAADKARRVSLATARVQRWRASCAARRLLARAARLGVSISAASVATHAARIVRRARRSDGDTLAWLAARLAARTGSGAALPSFRARVEAWAVAKVAARDNARRAYWVAVAKGLASRIA